MFRLGIYEITHFDTDIMYKTRIFMGIWDSTVFWLGGSGAEKLIGFLRLGGDSPIIFPVRFPYLPKRNPQGFHRRCFGGADSPKSKLRNLEETYC